MGDFSATADGACPVQFNDTDRGYVKPRNDAQKNLVVAREKIASDLGFLLGLPVTSIVIRPPDPPDWPYYSALSAAPPVSRTWGDGGAAHLGTAAHMLERLRAFWTWIGDCDHNGHPNNLVYSVKSGHCVVLAIDHSYSLCHGNAANSLAVGESQGYGTIGHPGQPDWTKAEAANISSLGWDRIEGVVRRLQALITPAEQDTILRILKERRDHLGALLSI